MNEFINEDFLLKNKKGKEIYHNYIKNLPIIDYHCHLDPKEIYDDIFLGDLGEAWLAGDHYKWRLMRSNGISEDYITGLNPSYEKYLKWIGSGKESMKVSDKIKNSSFCSFPIKDCANFVVPCLN